MSNSMFVLGLTGSVAMGKSTTARFFSEAGVPVHDADAVVHQLYEGAAVPIIEAAFPGTTADGKVDRIKLGSRVMNDLAALRQLEAIVHPLVQEAERRFLAEAEASGAAVAVLDIPLLFETGGEQRVDAVVVATAPPRSSARGCSERPGMTAQRLEAMLARQMPDSEKRRHADFVVDTSRGFDDARTQVQEILRRVASNAETPALIRLPASRKTFMREIVFDTETTGLDPYQGHRLVEIGCIELVNRFPSGKVFHKYVNPERDMPAEAYGVHGLSAEFLKDKPFFSDICEELIEFIGDAPLVAHNANFDLGFLNAELERCGRVLVGRERLVDTLLLARRRHPAGPNGLDHLCGRYGIDNSRRTKHGALLDAECWPSLYRADRRPAGVADPGCAGRAPASGGKPSWAADHRRCRQGCRRTSWKRT
jgi:DNA polymerase III epsilon subunit/dephospho-CoA kinase